MAFENKYLGRAIELAKLAAETGEVPVGAVVVKNNQIIGEGYNTTIKEATALGHAELKAISSACKQLSSRHLEGCDIYVTLEPCAMCAGAISNARISKLYYGAHDEKSGAVEHGARVFSTTNCHHKPEVYWGIMEDECKSILKDFFYSLRH